MKINRKKILIIIGGGISAYKSLDLIRLLKKNHMDVKTILTKSGKEFVTPLSLSTLTKSKTFENIFDRQSEAFHLHHHHRLHCLWVNKERPTQIRPQTKPIRQGTFFDS